MWKWLEKIVGIADDSLVPKEYRRARTKRGRFKADNKSTTDHNEAWVDGKSPKKVYKIKGRKYTLKKVIKEKK